MPAAESEDIERRHVLPPRAAERGAMDRFPRLAGIRPPAGTAPRLRLVEAAAAGRGLPVTQAAALRVPGGPCCL